IARGPLESSTVKSIGSQIALALDYVHGRGVVHRDVKPSNVLLCGDGRAVLSDFGIARLMGSSLHHTRTGEAIGSPAYLAPEQVAGEVLTPALDIYSLGLVLLEALTAERAFPGPPVEAAMARLTSSAPMPTRVGHEWASLLRRMTDRHPENRPTAREVAEALGAAELGRSAVGGEILVPDLAAEATGPLSLGSAEAGTTMALAPILAASARADQVTEAAVPPEHRRRWPILAVALGIAALAFSAFTVLHPASGISKTDSPSTPMKVPAKKRSAPSRPQYVLNGSAQVASPRPTHTPRPSAKPTKKAPAKPAAPLQTATAVPTPAPSAPAPSTTGPTTAPTAQASPQAVASSSP
ncbi:MAG: protein kinase domain-containing protein, partial [Marmoricola sp.]